VDKKTTSLIKLLTKRPEQLFNNTASDSPDLINNINIDQLQLKERLSTTTSKLDLYTPITLFHSTIFIAVTKLISASRNYRL